MKSGIIRSLTFLLILLLPAIIVSAGQVETTIIKYDEGRLCFPYGENDLIFPGCPFTIFQNSDSLYSGYIDGTLMTASETEPIRFDLDSAALEQYTVKITPAELDSGLVNIGLIEQDNYQLFTPTDFNGFKSYDSYDEMLLAYESGGIDAILSFDKNDLRLEDSDILSFPSTHYVALIPSYNRAGVNPSTLSTALYDYFNVELFDIYYEGEIADPFYCHIPELQNCSRIYDYDPIKGKQLLKAFDNYAINITADGNITQLNSTIRYFKDILSRHRVNTRSSDTLSLYLKFFRIDRIDDIIQFVESSSQMGLQSNPTYKEYLDLVKNYVELYQATGDESSQQDYLSKINRTLIEDLGIFPLFRPTVYFSYKDNIKGVGLDENGYLDLNNLRRIIMPPNAKKEN